MGCIVMGQNFFPRRAADVLSYTANFSARISEDPALYGLSADDAAGYAALRETFAEAYTRATNPGTDSRAATRAKNQAMAALEQATRSLGRRVRNCLAVTSEMRAILGLSVRNGGGSSPRIPRPEAPPILRVLSVVGRTVSLRLSDATAPTRTGKPRGAFAAVVFSYVGEDPPAEIERWNYRGQSTRPVLHLTFEETDLPPGTKVWITAQWVNPRGKSGPGCAPVYAHLAYAISSAA
jgi:hypothetical protein